VKYTTTPLLAWAADLDPSASGTLRQDITALRRTIGTKRHLQLVVDDLDVSLQSLEIVASRVYIDLILEVFGDQLVAIGTLAADWSGPCRRCLESVDGVVGVEDVREIFQKTPVDGETWELEEEFVDLRPMVRELVTLHLPTSPLCAEDCAGPAPDLFPTHAVDELPPISASADGDDNDAAPTDPRWSALADLDFDADQ